MTTVSACSKKMAKELKKNMPSELLHGQGSKDDSGCAQPWITVVRNNLENRHTEPRCPDPRIAVRKVRNAKRCSDQSILQLNFRGGIRPYEETKDGVLRHNLEDPNVSEIREQIVERRISLP